jgi:DNA-formamidopyrimidine glycosylase
LADDAYMRAVLRLDNGSDVGYRDVRRFGTWELFEPDELAPYLAARLGPEPLGPFSAARLGKRLDGRRAPLKSALLDQRTVAGLGNIYVDEALWRSRLHPLRVAGSLDRDELGSLYRAVRNVLRKGIERQGSTLRDYALPDGAYGTMQDEFRAYGRGGEPCDRCGTPIEKTRQFQGTLENINVQDVPGVGHISIDKNRIMQEKVISAIDAVVFGRSVPASRAQKPRQPGEASAVRLGTAGAVAVR